MDLPARNPFAHSILGDPTDAPAVDVEHIHHDIFRFLIREIENNPEMKQSSSVVLFGESGAGKTHLLYRLRRYYQNPVCQASAYIVTIKLDVAPQRLWRHIRRILAITLLERVGEHSHLEQIIQSRLEKSDIEDVEETLDNIIENTSLVKALSYLFRGTHRLAARRWLRGDSLPEDSLRALELPSQEFDGETVDLEEQAKDIVMKICLLAWPKTIVFCFDQLEYLIDHTQASGIGYFGAVGGMLHDKTPNVVLITCIQSMYLSTIHRNIRDSTGYRLLGHEKELRPLTLDEAYELIERLMDQVPDLAKLRREQATSCLWPLPEAEIRDKLVEESERLPRKIMDTCKHAYNRLLDFDDPNRSMDLETFLSQESQQRIEKGIATLAPTETAAIDDILQSSLTYLLPLLTPDAQVTQPVKKRDVEMAVQHGDRVYRFSLCNHNNMTSLESRLRRLRRTEAAPSSSLLGNDSPLILLRHAELPLGKQARATRQHLHELQQHGVRFYHEVSSELVATLNALHELLSEAKAGDLSKDGEAISAAQVAQWIKDDVPRSVQAFLDQLFGPGEPTPPEPDDERHQRLLEWLQGTFLADMATAAQALEMPADQLEAIAHQHLDAFGVLAGSPKVLYLKLPVLYDTETANRPE